VTNSTGLSLRSRSLAIEIDEHGDVGLAALGGGFVQTHGLGLGEVEAFHSPGDVVLDDAPQALVGDADEAGGGEHRHFADQKERGLLEQEGEAAALPSPGHGDAQHTVVRAVGARHLGRDIAVVLEEVEMPPSELGEVVSLAGTAAGRTGEQRAAVSRDLKVQFVWLRRGVEPLADQLPRRDYAKPQGQNVVGVHAALLVPSCRERATVLAVVTDASRRLAPVGFPHP
jgi:hypothetical protein